VISMPTFGLGRQLINGRYDGISLSLQLGSAALLNFSRAVEQPGEEGIQILAHLGRGPKNRCSLSLRRGPSPRWPHQH